jgi:hypothetical protein
LNYRIKIFSIGKALAKLHICLTGKLILQGKTGLFCVIMIQKGTVEGGARLQLFDEGSFVFLA